MKRTIRIAKKASVGAAMLASAVTLVAGACVGGPAGALGPSMVRTGTLAAPASSPTARHTGTTLPPAMAWAAELGPDAEMHASGSPSVATSESTNWAGYELTGTTTFTGVGAEWVQPAVVPSSSPESTSTWIGIDGVDDQTLIQAGVDEFTTGGVAEYAAWYEILPAPNTLLPTPVTPGDHMAVVILKNAPSTWTIEIQDSTKGWTFKQDFAYSGPASSAEWIQEDPTLDNALEPLADFGSVKFTDLRVAAAHPTAAVLTALFMVSTTLALKASPSTISTATTTSFTVTYDGPVPPPIAPPPATPKTGYDMVGSDGGVFVFNPPGVQGGFYGSLPTLHVVPNKPVVGIVPTVTDTGYFLVAADGGVFAFGSAPFLGSLPGIKVSPNLPIVGIVAANTDKGYFLVGKDGGVYAFGTVPFLGSLPGTHISVSNIIGIAATPTGNGYWVVATTGKVYAFGTAKAFTTTATTSPVTAIAGTPTGGGYWLVTKEGGVYPYGNATKKGTGTLPAIHVTPNLPVIGIVRVTGTGGYWLIGADGGLFAFGTAPFYGSLPTLGVHVSNIVGAVPN